LSFAIGGVFWAMSEPALSKIQTMIGAKPLRNCAYVESFYKIFVPFFQFLKFIAYNVLSVKEAFAKHKFGRVP
jgi:hypothetical protein